MTPQTIDPATPFPVTWADPADEALFWQHDAMHFPDPLAPMEAAMLENTLGQGFTYGANAYNAPLRVEVRTINGYEYQSMVPMTGTPDELAAQGALAEASIRTAIGSIDELWGGKVLPEVREHLGFWDAFDLEGATRAAFAAHVEQTWARLARVWELHFEIVLPAYLAISEFDELYRGLFADAGPLDSLRRRGGFAFAHGVPALALVRVVALVALVIGVSRAVVRAEAVLARLTGTTFVTTDVLSHDRMIDTVLGDDRRTAELRGGRSRRGDAARAADRRDPDRRGHGARNARRLPGADPLQGRRRSRLARRRPDQNAAARVGSAP